MAAHHGVDLVALGGVPGPVAERRAERRVVEQAPHRFAEVLDVFGVDQHAVDPVLDEKERAVGLGGHDRLPAAMASTTASPKGSDRAGCTTTSEPATMSSLSGGRMSPGMKSRSASPYRALRDSSWRQ